MPCDVSDGITVPIVTVSYVDDIFMVCGWVTEVATNVCL